MRNRVHARALLPCLLMLICAESDAGLELTVTRIADTLTPRPQGGGNFTSLATSFPPSVSGANVAFQELETGVYAHVDGDLLVVADLATPIPQGEGVFVSLPEAAIDGDTVVFRGRGLDGQEGIYRWSEGVIDVLVDLSVPIPLGGGTFSGFAAPAAADGQVVFIGTGERLDESPSSGVYRVSGGALGVVANEATAVPGGNGEFVDFSDPDTSEGTVVFVGRNALLERAIYTAVGDTLELAVGSAPPDPLGGGNVLLTPSSVRIDDGLIAVFGVSAAGVATVYGYEAGVLGVLTDEAAVPGLSDALSLSQRNLLDLPSSLDDIFLVRNGVADVLIARFDALDGALVNQLFVSGDALSGGSVVFSTFLTDGRSGVYRIDFSDPDDPDNDGVFADADNCTEVANANQRDTDADGIGNACDADLNQDCSVNFVDLGLMKKRFFGADSDADLDGDGAVNFIDLGIMKAGIFLPPGPSGVPNICDGN